MWQSKPFVVFFVIAVVVSLSAVFLGWRSAQFYRYLLRNGVQTKAEVVGYAIEPGMRFGNNHVFTYRFTDVQGKSLETRVTRNLREGFQVGQVIDVVYDPILPSRNVPFVVTTDRVYQPLRSTLMFSLITIGLTFSFGAFAFSKLSLVTIDKALLKRLFSLGGR